MKKFGKIALSMIIVLALGFLSGAAAIKASDVYESLTLPVFAPPAEAFRIVWPILYVILGIILYRLGYLLPEKEDSEKLRQALNLFWVQLIINLLWTPVFFLLNAFWASFFWILLLIGTAAAAFLKIRRVDRASFYLFIPYLLWIMYAAVLNFSIAVMN